MTLTFKRIWAPAMISVILVVLVPLFVREKEPSYEGKPLHVWLDQFDYTGSSLATFAPTEAVRHMGTNVLSFLLRRLQSQESRTEEFLAKILSHQTIINVHYLSTFKRQETAAMGFGALGPRAEAAIPQLSRLATNPAVTFGATRALLGLGAKAVPPLLNALTNDDAYVRQCAAQALGGGFGKPSPGQEIRWLCQGDESTLPLTVSALVLRINDSDANVRGAVSSALGEIAYDPTAIVPLLIDKLHDNDRRCRIKSLEGLESFGRSASNAIPSILDALSDGAPDIRRRALQAIREIAQDAEMVVPKLIEALADPDADCRTYAVWALKSYGKAACSAGPSLTIALSDKDEFVRRGAREVLDMLETYALANEHK